MSQKIEFENMCIHPKPQPHATHHNMFLTTIARDKSIKTHRHQLHHIFLEPTHTHTHKAQTENIQQTYHYRRGATWVDNKFGINSSSRHKHFIYIRVYPHVCCVRLGLDSRRFGMGCLWVGGCEHAKTHINVRRALWVGEHGERAHILEKVQSDGCRAHTWWPKAAVNYIAR